MLHADSARNRLIGIGLVSLTYLLFACLDSSAKWLASTGMPVLMVVWMRFVGHVLAASAVLLPLRGLSLLRPRQWRLHLLRGGMFMVMTGMGFWALQYVPLTVNASIFFTTPLLIALISARFLGERLDRGRWFAIAAGFAGVLIIVRPGSQAFHPAMLVCMVNAILYAAYLLMTRRLAAQDSPETIQYLPALVAAVGLAPVALAHWQWPATPLQWTLACLTGLFGWLGHYCLAVAHRYAPASVIAPFQYQQVFYLAVLGYLIFGDVPDALFWLGVAVVIASGLYLFQRERRHGREVLDGGKPLQ